MHTNSQDVRKQLIDLDQFAKEIEIERSLLIEKAINSSDPETSMQGVQTWKDLQPKSDNNVKTVIFDPFNVSTSLDFKATTSNVSYQTLRRMSCAPIIRSIVSTRVDQMAAFIQPQTREYQPGFVVRKKSRFLGEDGKMSTDDIKKANYITDFILNCGSDGNTWIGDDFDSFTRKWIKDSMELDQSVFEVVRNRAGNPVEFRVHDASLFRKAPDWNDPQFMKLYKSQFTNLPPTIKGYYPSHVQLMNEQVVSEFYPWDLCFAVRNPTSNLYQNGYGNSELEDLIRTVTWMLQGDEYNGKFFSQGSSPKGILKVTGASNDARLSEFRQQWQSMVQGYQNAWKTPVLEGDKVDWIDLQKNNRDMEFGKWQEYLIRLTCALYKIAPDEIGFDISKSQGGGLGQGGQDARLQFSLTKGLRPLMRHYQSKIDKFIVGAIDPSFEFVFVGFDDEDHDLKNDISKLSNYMTINEIRKHRGLKDLDGGDIIANAQFIQSKQAAMYGDPQSNQAVDAENGSNDNGDQFSDKSMEVNPLYDSFMQYHNNIFPHND